jgi:hypothetical protein
MMTTKPRHEALRFLLSHLVGGLAGAIVMLVAILWSDFAGLWTLIRQSPDGVVVVLLLFFGLFVTFGSVAMAIGVMSMRRSSD